MELKEGDKIRFTQEFSKVKKNRKFLKGQICTIIDISEGMAWLHRIGHTHVWSSDILPIATLHLCVEKVDSQSAPSCSHQFPNTGMLKSWCKFCDIEGQFNRDSGIYESRV